MSNDGEQRASGATRSERTATGADPSCIFCRIVAGEAPAHRVWEDATTLAFLDIFPVSEGHTLVITKDHHTNLFEASGESLADVARVSKRLAHALQDVLSPAGLMVFQLNGAAAGQTVFHYHLHLVPRWPEQELVLHTRVPGDPARLAEIAADVVARLEGPAE